MSKNERQGPREPATKLPNLQKKMRQQKIQVKKPGDKSEAVSRVRPIRSESRPEGEAMIHAFATFVFLIIAAQALADEQPSVTLDSAPPVVVKTIPPAGSDEIDPGLKTISVTFSKKMCLPMPPSPSPWVSPPDHDDERKCGGRDTNGVR